MDSTDNGPQTEYSTRVVTTPDGRSLEVREAGDPSGATVFVHHGTPASELFDAEMVAGAQNLGLHLVTWDRPGYAGSSPLPGRDVGAVATDAVTVADALGADHILTWGISGGGPHALACAALLPDRVDAVAVLASVAPYDAPGLDWLAGMGQDNLDEFGATVAGESELRAFLEPAREGMLTALGGDPQAVVEEMASLLPDVDAAYLRAHPWTLESFVHALSSGYDGWLEDDLAFSRPWGVDLGAITTPTLVLQGGLDLMVPPAHGTYLAGAIPTAELRSLPGDGHLTLLEHLDEVHIWLLSAR